MKSKLCILLPLLLAACGSDKAGHICPQVAAVRDLAQIADFGREEIPDNRNLVAAAKIESIEGDCAFHKNSIDADFELHLHAQRGAGLGGDRVEFPYFVSVVGQNDLLISKQNLSAIFHFSGKDSASDIVEKIHVAIPTGTKNSDAWRILVGFQLTPEQLAYNRKETTPHLSTANFNALLKGSR